MRTASFSAIKAKLFKAIMRLRDSGDPLMRPEPTTTPTEATMSECSLQRQW